MKSQRNSERGIAMFLCLFALLLLSAVGMALMFMGDTETSINSNFRSSQAAYYAAKAGLEEARDRIRYGTVSPPNPAGYTTIALPNVLPTVGSPYGVYYITNPGVVNGVPEVIQPWNWANKYHDDELCHENFTGLNLPVTPLDVPCTSVPGGVWYTNVASADPNTSTISAMPYKWVRITQKAVQATAPYCVDGSVGAACTGNNTVVCAAYNGGAPYELPLPVGTLPPVCEAAPNQLKTVYMITALAVTNTGARRMTQYEVAGIALPPFPAALTMDGDGPFMVPATSNAFTLSGNDKHSCGPGGPNMPGIGATSDPADTQIVNDINNPPNGQPRPQNYTGAGGTTPNVYNVTTYNPPMDNQFKYCPQIQQLYNNIAAVADQTFNTNNPTANLGTPTAPKVTIVNGDFQLNSTNSGGAGVLVVTGNLTFSGNPNFDGIVLVIGTGAVSTAAGGGNGNLYGAMLIANCFNAAKQWTGSTCDATNHNPGTGTNPCLPGAPTFNWANGGGTYNVQYDSCWVNNLGNRVVYRVLASREEMY